MTMTAPMSQPCPSGGFLKNCIETEAKNCIETEAQYVPLAARLSIAERRDRMILSGVAEGRVLERANVLALRITP